MTVTQQDRDAAADVATKIYGQRIASMIRQGKLDGHHLVQAFARHREQARADVEREIVAWLREQAEIADAKCAEAKHPNNQRNYAAGAVTSWRLADAIEQGAYRHD